MGSGHPLGKMEGQSFHGTPLLSTGCGGRNESIGIRPFLRGQEVRSGLAGPTHQVARKGREKSWLFVRGLP